MARTRTMFISVASATLLLVAAACTPPAPAGTLSGRLVDPVTGAPVAGATVSLGSPAGVLFVGIASTTGADGRFSFAGLTDDEYSLSVAGAPGRESGWVGCPGPSGNRTVVATFGDACTHPVAPLGDIELDADGVFRGRVLDSVTRTPVAGAYVSATDTTPTPVPGTQVVTDADGRFALPTLGGEEYGVLVERANDGYELGYVACPDPTSGEHQVTAWGDACTFSPSDLGTVLLDPLP